jgi:hypothetical protein
LREVIATLVLDPTTSADDDVHPEFIHLARVRIISGGQLFPPTVVPSLPWRIRLSAVSAWSLGSYDVKPESA